MTTLVTRRLGGALMAPLLGLLLLPASASAAAFTVNSSGDPGDGVCDAMECTLRDAIEEANTNMEPDDITFAAALDGATVFLASRLRVSSELTIDGDLNDDGTPDITVAAQQNGFHVFSIVSGANATLEGLVITGSRAGGGINGGGIANGGTLTVASSTISDNIVFSGSGGGIQNIGTLTVTNSTISGNSAAFGGGGIENMGTLTVESSTISGNSADVAGFPGSSVGGGILNVEGTLQVTNSTVSGNSASGIGGGIVNNDPLQVTNSAISGNSAGLGGGGIYNNPDGTVTIKSTIVAGNTAPFGADCQHVQGSTVTSLGFNLEGGTSCGFTTGDDQQQVDVADVLVTDANGTPLLADNGGLTQTIALVVPDDPTIANPALDAIPLEDCTDTEGTPVTADQRGVSRPQPADGNCDIGAFELVQEAPVTIADVIELFDQAVADGTLMGAGPGNSAKGRLNALRNMLLTAGELLEQGDVAAACTQLQDAAERTDGAALPPDFAQGPAAPDLLDAITELQDGLGCFA